MTAVTILANTARGNWHFLLTWPLVYIIIYTMPRTAKLFRNGRSQAVRLPSEYRFEGSEVFVRRDPSTGDVILSRRPESCKNFFAFLKTVDVPEDFLSDRQDALRQKRELFSMAVRVFLG